MPGMPFFISTEWCGLPDARRNTQALKTIELQGVSHAVCVFSMQLENYHPKTVEISTVIQKHGQTPVSALLLSSRRRFMTLLTSALALS